MFALTFGNGSPSICDSEEPINLYFLVLTCVLFCLMVVLSFLGFQCFVLDNYSIPAEFAALSYKWFYLEILRSIFSLHYVVYTSRIQIYKLKNINMCRSFARLSPAFCPLLTKEEIYLKKKKDGLGLNIEPPNITTFSQWCLSHCQVQRGAGQIICPLFLQQNFLWIGVVWCKHLCAGEGVTEAA